MDARRRIYESRDGEFDGGADVVRVLLARCAVHVQMELSLQPHHLFSPLLPQCLSHLILRSSDLWTREAEPLTTRFKKRST